MRKLFAASCAVAVSDREIDCRRSTGLLETRPRSDRLAFVHHYVIPAEDLILLNDLPFEDIRPIALEWINRGTDQKLNRVSISMLVRTLYQPTEFSQSVRRLHCAAGLRVSFRTAEERAQFKTALERLRAPRG